MELPAWEVAGESDAFFNGTDLVVEKPEKLELQELEKYLQRYHGLPVTIARTRRLTLREMIVDDWQVLNRIDHQSGMEKARQDAEETDSFEKSRLESYIGSQYRLYGYGLWSVVLDKERTDSEEKERCEAVGSEKIFSAKDGTADVAAGKTGGRAEIVTDITAGKTGGRTEIVTDITAGKTGGQTEIVTDITAGETGGQTERMRECVIGCCGFSALDERPDMQKSIEDGEDAQDQESLLILELQYMLDEAYRRQGYGTEMCRAAIAYAYEQLEADEIMVRVRSDYQEAISFARSIGFRPVSVKPENRAEDKQENGKENRPEEKQENKQESRQENRPEDKNRRTERRTGRKKNRRISVRAGRRTGRKIKKSAGRYSGCAMSGSRQRRNRKKNCTFWKNRESLRLTDTVFRIMIGSDCIVGVFFPSVISVQKLSSEEVFLCYLTLWSL